LRFAVSFVEEGLIAPPEALRRLQGLDLSAVVCQRLIDVGEPVGRATGVSVGVAVGRAAFDSAAAGRLAAADAVILIRTDISTADVAGFAVAEGILTAAGGRTAHAALVARQMGKPCVVGCEALAIDAASHAAQLGGAAIREGDWLSIDGEAGTIHLGRGNVVVDRPEADLAAVAGWRSKVPERAE
jgi:pyruvate,orthophosphate dikinase